MKKFLILMMVLVTSISSFAQDKDDGIEYDKTDDGIRCITAKPEILFRMRIGEWAEFKLNVCSLGDGNAYTMILRIQRDKPFYYDIGRKLLFKFEDDSMIELSNIENVDDDNIETDTWESTTFYYMCPAYEISEEDIQKICSNKVVKIRLEDNQAYVDKDMKKDKLSASMAKEYDNLKKALAKDTDIYTGF